MKGTLLNFPKLILLVFLVVHFKGNFYSVFYFIHLQKQGFCKHVFGLMGNPKAVLGPQDWEQMTIRPEILLNKIKNEFGRW